MVTNQMYFNAKAKAFHCVYCDQPERDYPLDGIDHLSDCLGLKLEAYLPRRYS